MAPPVAGSPLSLQLLELADGASVEIGRDTADVVVFGLEGRAELSHGDVDLGEATYGTTGLVKPGESLGLTSRSGGFAAIVAEINTSADQHAALGDREHIVQLDLEHGDDATGGRKFQILLGPDNGSDYATVFVGVVPPGAAPWHFHNYDEIVVIIKGGGVYSDAAGDYPTRERSTFRIPPRTVHINANTTDTDLLVLGVFTPAGSPSAAFLAANPRSTGEG